MSKRLSLSEGFLGPNVSGRNIPARLPAKLPNGRAPEALRLVTIYGHVTRYCHSTSDVLPLKHSFGVTKEATSMISIVKCEGRREMAPSSPVSDGAKGASARSLHDARHERFLSYGRQD
jgi:hypothetical protein